jgi:hypothetical protein
MWPQPKSTPSGRPALLHAAVLRARSGQAATLWLKARRSRSVLTSVGASLSVLTSGGVSRSVLVAEQARPEAAVLHGVEFGFQSDPVFGEG